LSQLLSLDLPSLQLLPFQFRRWRHPRPPLKRRP
jgi:hypothetical protein